jgi:hypothetical protein
MKRTVTIEQTVCEMGAQFARQTIESETLQLFDSVKHENEMYVVVAVQYAEPETGFSIASDNWVSVIGEQLHLRESDGMWIEQYVYNIDGYTPENGKPFAALKANIHIH